MDNPNISIERKAKRVDELYKLTERLSILLDSIGDYTDEELLNGFQLEQK
jgi:hypothetical protein